MDVEVARDQVRAQVAGGDAVLHGRGDDIRHLVGHGEGHRPVHVEDAGGPAPHHGPLPGLDVGRRLLFGDVVPGLLPGRLAEPVLATPAALDPDEGGLDAVAVIGLAQPGLTAGADLAPIQGRMGVAVQLDDALVAALGMGGDADVAQGGTEVTDAVTHLLLDALVRGECLVHQAGQGGQQTETRGAIAAGLEKSTARQTRQAPGHGVYLLGVDTSRRYSYRWYLLWFYGE